jgi:hypothetical protein
LNRSKVVSLSALAAAIGFLFLTTGFYLQVGEYGWYFAASVAIMLPLARGYLGGALLAVPLSCLLALLANGFNFVFLIPYITFMGFHPVINCWQRSRNKNPIAVFILKEAWFLASVFITFRFTALLLFDFGTLSPYALPIILAIAAVGFVPYDYAMKQLQKKIDKLAGRI